MNRWVVTLLLLGLAVPAAALDRHDGVAPIRPETPLEVSLSSSDVNRITCSEPISDLIYSSEKGLEGQFTGNNAFIKFKLARQGKEEVYATKPTELYIVCGGNVYTLIATPQRIPAVTLKLAAPRSGKSERAFGGLPFERKVLQLVQEGYRGEYPDHYKVSEENREISLSPDVRVIHRRTVTLEDESLRLKIFYLTGNPVQGQTLELSERDFLLPAIGRQIAALAIEDHTLPSGSMTRLFVIEHLAREERP
jgi:conjugal transfer pilus assembly protein TraK